jgi:hypothetical protein
LFCTALVWEPYDFTQIYIDGTSIVGPDCCMPPMFPSTGFILRSGTFVPSTSVVRFHVQGSGIGDAGLYFDDLAVRPPKKRRGQVTEPVKRARTVRLPETPVWQGFQRRSGRGSVLTATQSSTARPGNAPGFSFGGVSCFELTSKPNQISRNTL